MNEEIEYAQMLEIPVSTVNVVRKKRKKSKTAEIKPFQTEIQDKVIAQVNDKLTEDIGENVTPTFAETEEGGRIDFNGEFDIPQRIDTVRLYDGEEYRLENENGEGRYKTNHKKQKISRIVLGVEFALSCALCGAIFLTNVFMPNSAINTFFKTLTTKNTQTVDARKYSDFTLSSVVSQLSNAKLTVSQTGVISLTDECFLYPVADGKVSEIIQNEGGSYTVKITHSDSFSGVIDGLDQVYYTVGDNVKANVPIGFTDGEDEVQITMYDAGELLNCFEIVNETALAWKIEG